MSRKRGNLGVIRIDSTELLLNREGKANKGDLMVSRGCGEHIAVEYKKKTKQKNKNDLRRMYA